MICTGLALSLTAGNAAAATLTSSFDASAEGWTTTTFADNGRPNFSVVFGSSGVVPDFHGAGGDPGGFVSFADPDDGWSYFVAPAAYLGAQGDKNGGVLSFSLQHAFPSNGFLADPPPPHAVLQGGGLTLVTDAGEPPAITPAWTGFTVPLVASSWRISTMIGATPTDQQFTTVLDNLTGLFLSAEFVSPVVETNGLDSVALAPVPLPGAWWALVSSLAVLARRTRQRSG